MVVVALIVLWIVKVVVEAVVEAFQTPYPWIVLGVAGAGFACYQGTRIFRAQRREKLFFDAVAALRAAAPSVPELLATLKRAAADQADAFLLASADAASRGRFEDAREDLDQAARYPATVGALSGGIGLRFPGLPVPVHFGGGVLAANALGLVRGLLLVRLGRPRDALSQVSAGPSHVEHLMALWTVAEAHEALGDPSRAVSALREAIARAAGDAVLVRVFRLRLAYVLEAGVAPVAAMNEYEALLADRDCEDRPAVQRRLDALRAQEEAARHASMMERDNAIFERTVEKIEAAKGQAGRRAALRSGLAEIAQPDVRERLKAEASRIEVHAVLDYADGLKTTAAKRRNLLAALEAIRSDDVADELQAEQIQWLEQALDDLEGV